MPMPSSPAKGHIGAACPWPAAPRHSEHSFATPKTEDGAGPGIAAAIETPRLFRNETLPAGPVWEDLRQLIPAADSQQPRDIRDRAILLLFAVYGLRSGEVAKLRLEDIDWVQAHMTRCAYQAALLPALSPDL